MKTSTTDNTLPAAGASGTNDADTVIGGEMVIVGDTVTVTHLEVTDALLADLLRRCPQQERDTMLRRIMSVGAGGIATMGVGIDLVEVDSRVHRTVERVTDEAALRVQAMLEEAGRIITSSLDPDQRSSLIARAVADFGGWRDSFLTQVDPESANSHTGKLLARLDCLLGPGGSFEQRLTAALDPTADGTGLARVSELIERRFAELRELVAEDRGRRQEAERGTAKGFEFEDRIEQVLRTIARPLGVVVERTSRAAGTLGGEAIVGDFVMEWPSGGRLVIEAKNSRAISLTGRDGILGQLDRAMDNRDATLALCVSASDAFPREVGPFGVYGNRVLVVDEGDGTMLGVAIRWVETMMAVTGRENFEIDVSLIDERLQRIRMLTQRFSSSRRALTDIGVSVDKVRDSLDEIRRELLDLVDEAASEIRRSQATHPAPVGHVMELSREAG